MHLVSWNVNGIRACLRKGGGEWLRACGADVICLQETRASPEQAALELPGHTAWWNPARQPGYSGVAVFTGPSPLDVARDLGEPGLDGEGRVLTVEFPDLFVVTVYTPNAGRELARLAYRADLWDPAFLAHVQALDARKPVVFCGDLNVAHREIDLANPRQNRGNAGFTDEERAGFDRILAAGFLDSFREFEPAGGHYTWWSNRKGVREKNVGWRIDYVLLSRRLRPRLLAAAIHPQVLGSDHCPVSIRLR
ncbi:MAG TPA: exodeoxyribonuclease III [Candidatus Krumholzibacteria bacterium]|nr:exodeoxyribonuclease III [Candidatus Krumholzibacteria bacterium]HPD72403.1 exodeoxyribonuclease III [Candidatus Krumholzibacteria bacterium]HRY40665.1 exodeoxyribonuclease III [Candidatus Krumholzibacteria bacterium]